MKPKSKRYPERRKSGGGLKVLYQDKDLVVVHKPSGKTTYNDDRKNAKPSVLDELNRRLGSEKKAYPVHRLDRGTCGVLIFALTPLAASLLQRDFREGKVEKKYWALVLGRTPKKGDIKKRIKDGKEGSVAAHTSFITRSTFFIPTSPEEGESEVLPGEVPKIREGITVSWVECEPKTGRFHQIRQHFAMEGFPLVGDYDHGTAESQQAGKVLGLKRIALSAVGIELRHPRLRKPMKIETYPDREYLAVLESLVGGSI